MTSSYKQIQLTNTAIQDVAVDAYIPLGKVTRRINAPYSCCNTFLVTQSDANTVVINDAGFYKITYSLTASAAAAGNVTVDLVVNNTSVYSVTQNLVDETGSVNLTLVYTVRVCPNCSSAPDNVPVTVQLQNTGIALTGTSANLIIEKV
jgi:hypothetical protein